MAISIKYENTVENYINMGYTCILKRKYEGRSIFMKRVMALMMSVLMLCLWFPITSEAATENVILSVTADKSTAYRGDTITYSVNIGAVESLGGLEFNLKIPDGLTIIDDSISFPTGIETILDSDGDIVKPASINNYKWAYSAATKGYRGTDNLTILNFSCTVDQSAAFEEKNLSLTLEACFDTTDEMNDHNVAIVPAKVTIQKAPVVVKGISLNTAELNMKEGEQQTLTATITPSDADNQDVTWSSNNEEVATVANGIVKANKEGNAVITVTTVDGEKKATCSVNVSCDHSLVETAAIEPTCGRDGNILYYTCNKCGRKFSDAAGTVEVTNIVKPATEQHTPEVRNAVAATEDSEGYTGDIYCTVCSKKLASGQTVPKLDHTHIMSHVAAMDATCVTDGNIEYYICNKCHKMYTDAAGTKEVTNIIIAASGHSSDEWKYDDNNHWKKCQVCGAKFADEAHIYVWVVDQAATEDVTGVKHEECECGAKRSEGTVIEKLNHRHVNITYYPAVASTCKTEGHVEYWTCGSEKCNGKYYSDAQCQLEITDISLPVNPENHVYDNDTDAFCNECDYQRFYQVIDGANSTYTKDSTQGLTIRVDGEYELFDHVTVDGDTVAPENYSVSKGSTIITFTDSYLKTLTDTTHSIEVWYSDGKAAKTQLIVKSQGSQEDDNDDNDSSASGVSVATADTNTSTELQNGRSPKTGEGSDAGWMILLTVSAICLMGCGLYGKKEKNIEYHQK